MTRDEALDKLRKLRRLAERAGTQGEAQAALVAAAKLATRFSVQEAELEMDEALFTILRSSKGLNQAAEALLIHVCRMCGVFPVNTDDGVAIYGRQQDREVAKIVVLASLDTLESQFRKIRERFPRTKKGPFSIAFVQVLLERMDEAQNEVLDSIRTKALAVIPPKDRALTAQEECPLDTRKGKPKASPIDDPVSRARGAGAAENVKLPGEHKGIE